MFFRPVYILILFFTIVVDYFAGILIENAKSAKTKKWYLVASLISNIGVLAIFKYFNFLNENLSILTDYFGVENKVPFLTILLPIGLSFHTFQAMSYTFEVYYGRQKAEKHFGIYSLYVMFYPQLVAGPIERPQNILPQFHEEKHFDYWHAVQGINLIAYGLFKKIVVADRLAIYVNKVYADIDNASTISTILAVCFFSIQIYCDFSGYSDIARGTAKFMGYDLMINFNRPYLAKSISEFWSRWHISLSTWFRDYVYIPLGGNRGGKYQWLRNLGVVFVLSGFWHGANWTFIIWGVLHAIYLIFGIMTKEIRNRIFPFKGYVADVVNQLTVFCLVTFAWIFFRAESYPKAIQVIKKIIECDFSFNLVQICADRGPLNLMITFIALFLFATISLPKGDKKNYNTLRFVTLITFLIIIMGKNGTGEFIYFQF